MTELLHRAEKNSRNERGTTGNNRRCQVHIAGKILLTITALSLYSQLGTQIECRKVDRQGVKQHCHHSLISLARALLGSRNVLIMPCELLDLAMSLVRIVIKESPTQ